MRSVSVIYTLAFSLRPFAICLVTPSASRCPIAPGAGAMGWGQRWEGLINDDKRRRRGTSMSREASESCRPSPPRHAKTALRGWTPFFDCLPRAAPCWGPRRARFSRVGVDSATFSSRLRRWVALTRRYDRLNPQHEFLERARLERLARRERSEPRAANGAPKLRRCCAAWGGKSCRKGDRTHISLLP